MVAFLIPLHLSEGNKEEPFYVGVSFNGNTVAQAKLLIDRVKQYTNLFVLQSLPISKNETAIYETLDYATSQGLNIIVNLLSSANQTYLPMQLNVFLHAGERWGDKFLGAYYSDEPGGLQMDYNWTGFVNERKDYNVTENPSSATGQNLFWEMYMKVLAAHVNGTKPQDYDLEADLFNAYFKIDRGFQSLESAGIKTFVSDYTLFWFDYIGGYDVVLTQFGANSSYVQNIGLIRGAARAQHKEWGAIITWKYTHYPYLDTGDEVYREMMQAYQAGAKYVILFDYPYTDANNPYGVLQEEHFYALEKFSNDVMATSMMRTLNDESVADAVLVLPHNYGWGMRRQNDLIWGYWGPDEKSPQIWGVTQKLLTQYGVRLDIVYEDSNFPLVGKYQHVYFWNQTLDSGW